MKKTSLFCFITLFVSCSNNNKKFQIEIPINVINKAALFKGDVLKTIDHTDSLKIKSFEFVLDNIKYQKSKNGVKYKAYNDIINKYFNNDDSLVIEFKTLYASMEDNESYDVLTMNEEFLINDVEETLRTYSKSSWKDKIPFDVFNQYVLSYKANKYQPFENGWRSSLLNKFIKEKGNSIFDKDIDSAATHLHKWLYDKKGKFRVFFANDNLGIPDLSYGLLDKLKVGSCHEISALGVGYFRALGMPAAIDFTPIYLNHNFGHEWAAVVIDSIRSIPFDFTTDKIGVITTEFTTFSKVYRRTYAPNKNSHFMHRGQCDFVPDMFNDTFIEDVTHQYTETSDVEVPISESVPSKFKFSYLCVFNKNTESWSPVSWGTIEDGKASFSNVGTGGVYLAILIEEEGAMPINSAFLLDKKGDIKFLTTDQSQTESVKLLRKYSDNVFKDEQKYRMIGGIFQGANNPDFSDAIDLYTISENPGDYFNNVDLINNIKGFRYVRYYSPKASYGNIAEIEFYQLRNDNPLKGSILGTDGSYLDDPKRTKEAVFDGKVLTFFDSKFPDYSWVGLDLGTKKEISKIRFIARNDMNGVQIGNTYELVYWENEWKSLGQKVADTTFLKYDNVPKNALLWLKNLTEGKEERIFTYEDGEQMWW